MRRMTVAGRFFVSRKHLKYNTLPHSEPKYKISSPETMLSELIHVEKNKLNQISNTNLIYDLLIKIKPFKEFMKINNLDKETILNLLNTGILKSFDIDEKVYKKGTYPQFYFLVLVGIVSYYNKSLIPPGTFFGDEIIREVQYKNTAFASEENTILLLIPKELFISCLKDNIINTNGRIEKALTDSFHIFKTFDISTYNKNIKKMVKLFPFTGQIIITNEEIANSIFIIFKGSCALNMEENEDLIILGEGDIFGIESLMNLDEDRNILKGKYLYNIINKSPDTIIFKFFIKDLNHMMINSLKNQLAPYFVDTKNIIQKYETMREDLKNKLMKKYRIFEKKHNIKKLFYKTIYNEISPERTEKNYYKALGKIQFNQKNLNDKQKLILKQKILFKKKPNNRNNLLQKIVKSKSFIYSKENSLNSIIRKKIMKNILLKKDKKEIEKIILNSNLKKINNNSTQDKEQKEKEKENKRNLNTKNKSKHVDKINDYNNSFKYLNISDNSKNNSFFFTTINYHRNRKNKENVYKTISILSAKDRIKKIQKKMSKHIKGEENSKNIDEGSKTMFASTFRDTNSYKNKSQIISAKKQIEAYGCTALDTMNYFNYGDKEKLMNSSNIENNNQKKINFKKCIFYETNKYNIPLFVLCDDKAKIEFPQLINF